MERTEDLEAWQRVGRTIASRRADLGLSQAEAAVRAGISSPAWQVIERTRQVRFRQQTIRGVCRALGWSADSIDRILRGEDPIADLNSPVLHELQSQSDAALIEEARQVRSAKSTADRVSPYTPELDAQLAEILAEVRGLRAEVADLKKKAK